MKKAFIVTSAIDIDNSFPLTYSNTRSAFTNEERLRHTVFTLASLDARTDNETTLFLVDISDNYSQYRSLLSYQRNLVYVSVKEEFPEVYKIAKSHPNKSYCETLILLAFINKYKAVMEQFDYIFKISGRYFIDRSFDVSLFNEYNKDKIFFKRPMKFEWNNSWPYDMVDQRSLQGDNLLYQYSSVLYGFGADMLDRIIDIYHVIETFTGHPDKIVYDVETLLYYFTRVYQDKIIETDWTIYGWDGTSGTFLRY